MRKEDKDEGTPRLKRKVILQGFQRTLKNIGVALIPKVEEVNMTKDDDTVIHIHMPEVEASLESKTIIIKAINYIKRMSIFKPSGYERLSFEDIKEVKHDFGINKEPHKKLTDKSLIKDVQEKPDLVANFDDGNIEKVVITEDGIEENSESLNKE